MLQHLVRYRPLHHQRLSIPPTLNLYSLFPYHHFSSSASSTSDIETEYKPEIDLIQQKYEFNQQNKQRLTGIVVSDRASKSISVQVKHFKYISKYSKYLPVRKKIMAHDENEVR